jgi:allantoin racemase
MRILVVNPNTTMSMTEAIGEACRKAAQPSTEIVAVSPDRGPRSIEGYVEDYVAAVATLETIAANRGRYDAFVIACFGDPGLHAARELVEEPVIGIAEAAMHMACLVAHKFSIVSVIHRIKPLLEDMVGLAGMSDRCASIRTTELAVLDIEKDYAKAEQMLIDEGRRAMEEDGAEAICLGCAGMGPLDKGIQAALGIPVLDGCGCAVKMAEACFDYGIKTSKFRVFKAPEPKEYVDWPAFDRSATMSEVRA